MSRYLAIPLLLLLAGCGAQVLREGEPNFNTAILLPDPSVSARNIQSLGLTPATLPDECQVAVAPAGAATVPAAPMLAAPAPPAAVVVVPPASVLAHPPIVAVVPAPAPAQLVTPAAVDVSNCVFAVKAIIDDLYREYRITLHHFADDGNATADITVLGLTTAATGPIGSSTKTILSGVATLIGGSKSILNQDLLFQKAIEDVINQMDIDRDTQFNTIQGQLKGGHYSLEQAKADLLEYFADGTWDHAIVSLQTTVAAKKANCKAQTDATKVNVAQTGTPTTPGGPAPVPPPSGGAAPSGGSVPAPATGTTTPAPTTNDCGPTPAPQPPALTPQVAVANKIFQATNGVTFYKILTAAKLTTDNVTIAISVDGKNFTAIKQPMAFTTFARLVNPVPINP